MHDHLNFQSDRIERVLAAHRMPVRVSGGTVTPRWIRFELIPALGARVNGIRNLSEELALALGAPSVRLARHGDRLTLELPRPNPPTVTLADLLNQVTPWPRDCAALGLGEDGWPVLLKLSAPEVAHVLVAGTTGSGKTELLRAMLASLVRTHRPAHLQVALIDPKQRGLAAFSALPHALNGLSADPQVIVRVLHQAVQEMERRDRTGAHLPRIVVAVDELAEVVQMCGPTAITALTRLAQRGREAGIHLLACTQKPSAAILGGLLKANFPARLVGRVACAEDARVATGQAKSGAEKLLGRGDFLAVIGPRLARFQAARMQEAP